MASPRPAYDESVFINCPFDAGYENLFRAILFTVIDCGFTPHCALEISNAAQTRLEKIYGLIESCKFGIHDLSRTELDAANSLPRFNMPLELGLFLGCQRFGSKKHKSKCCIVFDKERFRYQKFISDISGQDVEAHGGDYRALIHRIRDWLRIQKGSHLPGGDHLCARYVEFLKLLPDTCAKLELKPEALSFADIVYLITYSSKISS